FSQPIISKIISPSGVSTRSPLSFVVIYIIQTPASYTKICTTKNINNQKKYLLIFISQNNLRQVKEKWR
ncbi:MAG: hypothetical protein KAR51_04560, partial [Candidatus Aenigmarchaeota archaeon]|nr:hypothetical protein [Candidatus Aenigmarchaeota archaeon]